MYKFKHQLCFEQELLPFLGEIVKQFALFSEKFTQLFKNFTRPPVAAVAPNINSARNLKEEQLNVSFCLSNVLIFHSTKLTQPLLKCIKPGT